MVAPPVRCLLINDRRLFGHIVTEWQGGGAVMAERRAWKAIPARAVLLRPRIRINSGAPALR